jgi:hypothetical protein
MPPSPPPQPTRFAIQKARGRGWKTLEVGEELPHARARFALTVKVNPRGCFRLIRLDQRSGVPELMEFDWTLVELHDPNRRPQGRGKPPSGPVEGTARRRGEKVPLPLRLYLAVIAAGLLVGLLASLRYGLPPR